MPSFRALTRFTAAIVVAATIAMASSPATAAPARYIADGAHLTIAFLVDHIGFAKTLGMFRKAEGSFTFDEDGPTVSGIAFTIDAKSVFTNHKARDKHLRGKDFLWVKKFPEITFAGTSATPTAERTGTVTGDLTLRGVTRPVTLEVTWNKTGAYPFGDKSGVI